MSVSFSLTTPLFAVAEDAPAEVTASARLHVDVDGDRKNLGSVVAAGDAGVAVPPETYEPLHQAPVVEGRGLPGEPA